MQQAANTTLILLEPVYDATQMAGLKEQVARFLSAWRPCADDGSGWGSADGWEGGES